MQEEKKGCCARGRENIHTLHLLNRFFDYLFRSIEARVKFYMLWNNRCLNHYFREVKNLVYCFVSVTMILKFLA